MRTYRVTFQPHTGRSAEDVQADRMSIQRSAPEGLFRWEC